jgi:hypothetical protein
MTQQDVSHKDMCIYAANDETNRDGFTKALLRSHSYKISALSN